MKKWMRKKISGCWAVLGCSGKSSDYVSDVHFDVWLHSRDIVLLIMISLLVSAWYQHAWSLHESIFLTHTNTVSLMSVSGAWGGVTLSTQPRNLFPPEKGGMSGGKMDGAEERGGQERGMTHPLWEEQCINVLTHRLAFTVNTQYWQTNREERWELKDGRAQGKYAPDI